jgi:hypothetical protein
MSRESDRSFSGARLGAAPRAYLALCADETELADETSRARKLAALGFALLVLIAVPLLWAAGPGNDQAIATPAMKSSNSGPGGGGGDDDDNSGPGGNSGPGSGNDDDSATATSLGNRETAGTTNAEATTKDGTATSRGARDTRGTTRGEQNSTRVTNTGTTRAGDTTNGTTAGNTTV